MFWSTCFFLVSLLILVKLFKTCLPVFTSVCVFPCLSSRLCHSCESNSIWADFALFRNTEIFSLNLDRGSQRGHIEPNMKYVPFYSASIVYSLDVGPRRKKISCIFYSVAEKVASFDIWLLNHVIFLSPSRLPWTGVGFWCLNPLEWDGFLFTCNISFQILVCFLSGCVPFPCL